MHDARHEGAKDDACCRCGWGQGNFDAMLEEHEVEGYYESRSHSHNDYLMNAVNAGIPGFLAALCTTCSFLPQVIKTIKIKETKDISFSMYAILIAGVLLWIIYGILKQDVPVIVANVITFVLATTVLILKIKHG